jgi:two-component system, OmpR family, sensor histidine kinase QseC
MTLQRRLTLLLLAGAPIVWALALGLSFYASHHEINELFDTQLIRLARQVQSTLPLASIDAIEAPEPARAAQASMGDAELEDLAIAVWNREGKLLLVDREGVLLPHRPDATGFADMDLGSTPATQERWRVYYLQAASGNWLIAVGQIAHERDELVWDLIAGQLLPWVLTLPVLLLVMTGAVRRALKPLRTLTDELGRRKPGDLRPLATPDVPTDLRPLVGAMNTLLARIGHTLERERRFTADAAHELRTPLAALQAQWEASQLTAQPAPQPARDAGDKIGQSLGRLTRLVTQLLSLSRLDHVAVGSAGAPMVDWHAVSRHVLNDLLPLADQRRVELACEWPEPASAALPLHGDAALLAAMLRNLLDNALRHSPPDAQVTLRFSPDAIEVSDEGPGVAPEHLARLGDRFYRPAGSPETGSGLGLSIVRRIAELHGLRAEWGNRADRSGFAVRLQQTV